MINNIEYSVIIPIWNGEKYIDRCLESLICQDSKFYEIILVDNGSTDNSWDKCSQWASKYDFIRLYKEPQNGASNARNKGIEEAKGEYITFVDIDDTVTEDFLTVAIDAKKLFDYDLLVAKVGKTNSKNIGKDNLLEFKGSDGIKDCFNRGLLMNTGPFSKFYKRTVFEEFDIKFPPDVIVGEDAVFLYTYLLHINSIIVSSRTIYNYCENSNSITHKYYSLDQEWQDYVRMRKALMDFKDRYTLSIDDKSLWSILTSRLRRYIKAFLTTKGVNIKALTRIPPLDTSHYGLGQDLSKEGKIFRYIVKLRLFTILLIINRIK